MNVQKMGALCRKNYRLKMARGNGAEFLSDGITLMELPMNFPSLPDERACAAVFGWKESTLEKIGTEIIQWQDGPEVFGIDMRDAVPEEIACVKAEVGILYGGMKLLVLFDDMGGIGFIDSDQLAPVADELRDGEYMMWFKRRSHGRPYYVLKNGLLLRLAVMPVIIRQDVMTNALEEIIDRMKQKAGNENATL